MNKNKLRKLILNNRNLIKQEIILKKSKLIMKSLESLEIFQNAKTLFIYVSFNNEIDTINIIKKYINKKIILVPKLVNKEMKLVQINSLENLARNNYGILEPLASNFFYDKVDLVITPGLAFDKNGYRIGYGGGYYDRYFKNNNYDYSIGLVFEKFLFNKLPIDENDMKVDFIITEERLINV